MVNFKFWRQLAIDYGNTLAPSAREAFEVRANFELKALVGFIENNTPKSAESEAVPVAPADAQPQLRPPLAERVHREPRRKGKGR